MRALPHKAIIYFVLRGYVTTLVETSLGATIKDGQIPSPHKGRLGKLIHIVLKPYCVTLSKVDSYSFGR